MNRRSTLHLIVTATAALAAAPLASASTLTWEYDPDSNQLPNAAGQPFAGGAAATAHASIVDIGGGDLVLNIDTKTADTNAGTFFIQNPNSTPGKEWNVNAATGFSIEWRVQIDPTQSADPGSADLGFADGTTSTNLRLQGGGGSNLTALIRSGGTQIGAYNVPDPTAYHTYRIDKVGNSVDLWVDGVLVLDNVLDPNASANNSLQFGDLTGANDGSYRTQFLRTYQSGVIPEPGSVGLLGAGALLMFVRRRRRVA